jgi:hypothetical protein
MKIKFETEAEKISAIILVTVSATLSTLAIILAALVFIFT